MVNIIFICMFILGLGYGMLCGRVDEITAALVSAPKESIMIFINLTALMIFWSGILEICKSCGLLQIFTKGIRKIIHPLFKSMDVNEKALEYISINFAANMLGMSSAATPFGLKAMKELDKLNNHSDTASKDMITLLVINTSGLCLIPSTIIALRDSYDSQNSSIVIPYIMLLTLITTFFAIIVNGVFKKYAD